MKYFGNGASSKCYQSCRKEPRGKSGEDVRGQTVSVAKWFFGRGKHAHATTLLKTLERDVERQNAGKKPRCFL